MSNASAVCPNLTACLSLFQEVFCTEGVPVALLEDLKGLVAPGLLTSKFRVLPSEDSLDLSLCSLFSCAVRLLRERRESIAVG